MELEGRVSGVLRRILGDGIGAHLIRGVLGTGSLGLINKGLSLLIAIFLARSLGAEGYGYYAFATAVVALISIPSQFGLPQLLSREVAACQAKEEWSLLQGLRRRVAQIALITVIVGALGFGGLFLALADFIAALDPVTFAIALMLLPLQVATVIASGFLRGLRHVIHAAWPTSILWPGFFLLFLLVFGKGLSANGAMSLNVSAAMIPLLASVFLLRRLWPQSAAVSAPSYRSREWLSSLLPFALLASVNLVVRNTDIFMLGVMTSANEVGIYNIAVQGSILVSFSLFALNSVLAPNIARLFAQGELGKLQRLATISTAVMTVVAALTGLPLLLAGEWLLKTIFGATYEVGYTALAILVLGQMTNATMGSVGLFLSMTGHEKDTLRGLTISAALNVVLNAALIPPFGINGAAIATVISILTWNIILGLLVYRRLGIVPGPFGPICAIK